MAFSGKLEMAVYLIWLAMIFDFFDGLAARALKVSSPIGKELDSLADMVSFGVLPACLIFLLIENENLAYIAFTIAVFSALRLAKFNTDTRQENDFIGLPTPANALFLSALVFVNQQPNFAELINDYTLIIIAIIFSLLLVSPIRLFSLKVKSLGWKENSFRYLFLISSVLLIAILGVVGLPLSILLYIALSIVQNSLKSA